MRVVLRETEGLKLGGRNDVVYEARGDVVLIADVLLRDGARLALRRTDAAGVHLRHGPNHGLRLPRLQPVPEDLRGRPAAEREVVPHVLADLAAAARGADSPSRVRHDAAELDAVLLRVRGVASVHVLLSEVPDQDIGHQVEVLVRKARPLVPLARRDPALLLLLLLLVDVTRDDDQVPPHLVDRPAVPGEVRNPGGRVRRGRAAGARDLVEVLLVLGGDAFPVAQLGEAQLQGVEHPCCGLAQSSVGP